MSLDNKLSIVPSEQHYILTDDSNDFRASLAEYIRTQCEAEANITTLSTKLAKLANNLLKEFTLLGDVDFVSLHSEFFSSDFSDYSKQQLRLLILDVLSEGEYAQNIAELTATIWSITFGKAKEMKGLAEIARSDQDDAIAELSKFLSNIEQPLSRYGQNCWYETAAKDYLENLTENQKIRFLPRLKETLAKEVDSVAAQAFLKQLEILYQPRPISYESILNQA